MNALEKRDTDKLKTDEAKNDFESLIYEFRDFIDEESNHKYEKPEEIEKLSDKCR